MFTIALILLAPLVSAQYAVHYAAPRNHVIYQEDKITLGQTPSPQQVADIIARLNGHAPILHEDEVHLPSADIFREQNNKVTVLAVNGGSKCCMLFNISLTLLILCFHARNAPWCSQRSHSN